MRSNRQSYEVVALSADAEVVGVGRLHGRWHQADEPGSGMFVLDVQEVTVYVRRNAEVHDVGILAFGTVVRLRCGLDLPVKVRKGDNLVITGVGLHDDHDRWIAMTMRAVS